MRGQGRGPQPEELADSRARREAQGAGRARHPRQQARVAVKSACSAPSGLRARHLRGARPRRLEHKRSVRALHHAPRCQCPVHVHTDGRARAASLRQTSRRTPTWVYAARVTARTKHRWRSDGREAIGHANRLAPHAIWLHLSSHSPPALRAQRRGVGPSQEVRVCGAGPGDGSRAGRARVAKQRASEKRQRWPSAGLGDLGR